MKKGAWTEEEDKILMSARGKFGNKWAEIAKLLPGRVSTDKQAARHFLHCRSSEWPASPCALPTL